MFKQIKELKDECPICEKKRNLVYGKRTEVVKVRGEVIPVKVNVYYCTEGDHYFYALNDEEDKYQTAYREFRKRKVMLQPEDIRELRNKYDLSQRAFSKLLGCSPITIQRYETGALQDDVHNNLLLILNDHYSFKHFFETKKSSLPDKISRTIEKSLRRIDEKEKQLELDFFFNYVRLEGAEVIVGKSANKEPLKTLLSIFARQAEQQVLTSVDIAKTTELSCWQPRRKPLTKNGDFSINTKGELALAA